MVKIFRGYKMKFTDSCIREEKADNSVHKYKEYVVLNGIHLVSFLIVSTINILIVFASFYYIKNTFNKHESYMMLVEFSEHTIISFPDINSVIFEAYGTLLLSSWMTIYWFYLFIFGKKALSSISRNYEEYIAYYIPILFFTTPFEFNRIIIAITFMVLIILATSKIIDTRNWEKEYITK